MARTVLGINLNNIFELDYRFFVFFFLEIVHPFFKMFCLVFFRSATGRKNPNKHNKDQERT
jgi:hypothetical protein